MRIKGRKRGERGRKPDRGNGETINGREQRGECRGKNTGKSPR